MAGGITIDSAGRSISSAIRLKRWDHGWRFSKVQRQSQEAATAGQEQETGSCCRQATEER